MPGLVLVASDTLRTECHRDSQGCFCMFADAGEIPVNGHAESANEGLSDRSRVRKSAERRDVGVGVKPFGSPPDIDAGSMDRIAFG